MSEQVAAKTDIVDRLRAFDASLNEPTPADWDMLAEAADEIERLRTSWRCVTADPPEENVLILGRSWGPEDGEPYGYGIYVGDEVHGLCDEWMEIPE